MAINRLRLDLYPKFINRIFESLNVKNINGNKANKFNNDLLEKGTALHHVNNILVQIQNNDKNNFFMPNIMYDSYNGTYIGRYEHGNYLTRNRNDVARIEDFFNPSEEFNTGIRKIYKNINEKKSIMKSFAEDISNDERKAIIQTLAVSLVAINRIKRYVHDGDSNYCSFSEQDLLAFKDGALANLISFITIYNEINKEQQISYGWKVDKSDGNEIDSFIIDIPGYSQVAVHAKGVKDEIINEAIVLDKNSGLDIDFNEIKKDYNMKLYENNIGGLPHKSFSGNTLYRLKQFNTKIVEMANDLKSIKNLEEAENIVKAFSDFRFNIYISYDEDAYDREFEDKIREKYEKSKGFSNREIFYLANGLGCDRNKLEMIQEACILHEKGIKVSEIKNDILKQIKQGKYKDGIQAIIESKTIDCSDEEKKIIESAIEKAKYEVILPQMDLININTNMDKSKVSFIRTLKNMQLKGIPDITIDCSDEYEKIAKKLNISARNVKKLIKTKEILKNIDMDEKNKDLYELTFFLFDDSRCCGSELKDEILNHVCKEDVKKSWLVLEENGIGIDSIYTINKALNRQDPNQVESCINNLLEKIENNENKGKVKKVINQFIGERDYAISKRETDTYTTNIKNYINGKSGLKLQDIIKKSCERSKVYSSNIKSRLKAKFSDIAFEELCSVCGLEEAKMGVKNIPELVNIVNTFSEKQQGLTDTELEFILNKKMKNDVEAVNELLTIKNNNNGKIKLPIADVRKIINNKYNNKSGRFAKIMRNYYGDNCSNDEINKINSGVSKLIKSSIDQIVIEDILNKDITINNYVEAEKLVESMKKYEISYNIKIKKDQEQNSDKETMEENGEETRKETYTVDNIVDSLKTNGSITEEEFKKLKNVTKLKSKIKTAIICEYDINELSGDEEIKDYAEYVKSEITLEEHENMKKINNIISSCACSEEVTTLDGVDSIIKNIENESDNSDLLDRDILRKYLIEFYGIDQLEVETVGIDSLNNTNLMDRMAVDQEEKRMAEKNVQKS